MKKLALLSTLTLAIATSSFVQSADARPRSSRGAYNTSTVEFLPHPVGCPRTRFCGCGARKDLGISDVRLNLASNWLRYYRGTTQVAVWRGHVAIIEQRLGNGMALLRDYNSGGHKSRRHVRSIANARIVGGGVVIAASQTRTFSAKRHRSTQPPSTLYDGPGSLNFR